MSEPTTITLQNRLDAILNEAAEAARVLEQVDDKLARLDVDASVAGIDHYDLWARHR